MLGGTGTCPGFFLKKRVFEQLENINVHSNNLEKSWEFVMRVGALGGILPWNLFLKNVQFDLFGTF